MLHSRQATQQVLARGGQQRVATAKPVALGAFAAQGCVWGCLWAHSDAMHLGGPHTALVHHAQVAPVPSAAVRRWWFAQR